MFQGLPLVTAGRMREIDREAVEGRGLKVIDLMENAGQAVAAEAAAYLQKPDLHVAVCCGRGANGGDGLVAARALKEKGIPVEVFICAPKDGAYPEPVTVNLERAKRSGVTVTPAEDAAALLRGLRRADLILDGLLGTGSSGTPSGTIGQVILAINRAQRPVIAIDIPSGLDPDTGTPSSVCVKAALTLTLGLPKVGLVAPQAKPCVGELKVLDIGFPKDILHP